MKQNRLKAWEHATLRLLDRVLSGGGPSRRQVLATRPVQLSPGGIIYCDASAHSTAAPDPHSEGGAVSPLEGVGTTTASPEFEVRTPAHLTKIMVHLVPRAAEALDQVSNAEAETKAESINRALQMYAWISAHLKTGKKFCFIEYDQQGGKIKEIRFT